MSNKIKIGIIGGAGYTGGELIRLLIHHPGVSVSFIHSRVTRTSLLLLFTRIYWEKQN
jgi:N-acetyl-gamma-glutamylphosphate reductase